VAIVVCPFPSSPKNQLAYTRAVTHQYFSGEGDFTIDLDKLIDDLPKNKEIPLVYKEHRQQKRVTCKCRNVYDILGEHGYCPYCRRRNSLEVFESQLSGLQNRITGGTLQEADLIDILKNCVSAFEGMANDLREQLVKFPASERRKKNLSQLNFQNLTDACEKLRTIQDIDYLEGLKPEDRVFLDRAFNWRHLFTHKSGVVDAEYISRTGDSSMQVGQKVRVSAADIKRLLGLVRVIGRKLFAGFESIS